MRNPDVFIPMRHACAGSAVRMAPHPTLPLALLACAGMALLLALFLIFVSFKFVRMESTHVSLSITRAGRTDSATPSVFKHTGHTYMKLNVFFWHQTKSVRAHENVSKRSRLHELSPSQVSPVLSSHIPLDTETKYCSSTNQGPQHHLDGEPAQ